MTCTKRLQAHINNHKRQGDLLNEREDGETSKYYLQI